MGACRHQSLQGNCTVCPYIPGVPAVPAHYVAADVLGWNAGANTIDELDGDVHVVTPMPAPTLGCLLGFKASRNGQTIPALIAHGLYFTTVSGVGFVTVMEYGAPKAPAAEYADGDVFEIRRVASRVTYWHGDTLLYASTQLSSGTVLVNACLYAAEDRVP